MNDNIAKALVVDDSRLARIALSKLLRKRDWAVDAVGTGAEALAYVREQRPDVVFMDYMMPDMDGFEATRQLREQPGAAAVPVVMYTSQDTAEDRRRAGELGVVDFLTKPGGEESLDRVLGVVGEYRVGEAPVQVAAPAMARQEADGPPQSADGAALRDELAVLAARAADEAVAGRLGSELEARVRAILDPALDEAHTAAREAAVREAAAAVERSTVEPDTEALAERLARETTARVIDDIGPEASQRILDEAAPAIERQLQEWMHSEAFTVQFLPQFLERAQPPLRERLSETLREPLREALSAELTTVAREAGERAAGERGRAEADAVQAQVHEQVARESAALRRLIYAVAGVAAVAIGAVGALAVM